MRGGARRPADSGSRGRSLGAGGERSPDPGLRLGALDLRLGLEDLSKALGLEVGPGYVQSTALGLERHHDQRPDVILGPVVEVQRHDLTRAIEAEALRVG